MHNIVSRLVGKLTVGRKLTLIYLLDLTAVIFVSGILIHEKFIAINFAEKEIAGNQYINAVRHALLSSMTGEGGKSGAAQRRQTITVEGVAYADQRFGDALGTGDLSAEFIQAIRGLAPASAPDLPRVTQIDHGEALAKGKALLTRIGNQSNLILDPDLDSYYTMSLVVLRFPDLLEVLHATRRLAYQESALSPVEHQKWVTQFLILAGRFDAIVKGVQSDYNEAYAASTPELKMNLSASQAGLLAALDRFRVTTQSYIDATSMRSEDAALDSAYMNATLSLRDAWEASQGELDRLLQARIQNEFHRMWTHLGTAALLLAVILSVVYFVARQIALPIRHLAHVAENVRRSGDYTLRAAWVSEDEIGQLVSGFNSMLDQLDRQRIEQQELVAKARAAEAQRELVDSVPIPMLVTAVPHHEVLHANQAAQAWLDGQNTDPWKTGMEPASRVRFFQRLSDVGAVDEFEVRWKGGAHPTWTLISARRVAYQGVPAIISTFTPIGQIKSLEARLELWAKVFEASSEGIVLMDANGLVMSVNSAFCRSTSYDSADLLGKHPGFLLSDHNDRELFASIRHTATLKGSWQGEVWIRGKRDVSYPAWLVVNAVRDAQGDVTHFIAISLDISDRKANEQHIQFLAHHDALTGLPNRVLFEERLTLSIQQARRKSAKVGILFVDLDRFKNINDSLGHHIGDGLLRSVGMRLLSAVREGDTVSRLGGDEFVVILNDVKDAEEIARIIDHRLLPMICTPHQVEGSELYISCSVGVSVFPEDGNDIDQLMRNADSAMYEAKKLGRNNAQFFTQKLNDRIVRHLHLESELRHAIEREELVLHYQPRVLARDGGIAGMECLLRWQHPREGLMHPAQFIPIAEETGLIVSIGAWTIKQACKQHLAWRAQGLGEIPISVNLSAIQLRDGILIDTLQDALTAYPIDASQIELELTESLLMENVPATIETLDAIKGLGFSLSVDDFGTGYSSLNYLYRFPIDKLKIDKSFISNVHSAPHSLTVIKAIIGLGHTLGMKVVAEGVEREADVNLLKAAGCDELQGYFFSRPKPEADIHAWIRHHQPCEPLVT